MASWWMNAKYNSNCAECKEEIQEGDRIVYEQAEKGGLSRAYCKECGTDVAGDDSKNEPSRKDAAKTAREKYKGSKKQSLPYNISMGKKKEVVERILICGPRKWTKPAIIRKTLRQYDYKKIDCVIIGTNTTGVESLSYLFAREMKFNVLLTPPNYLRDGINARFFRNDWVMQNLKPTKVLIFHPNIDDDLDDTDQSAFNYRKLAKKKGIEFQVVDGK